MEADVGTDGISLNMDEDPLMNGPLSVTNSYFEVKKAKSLFVAWMKELVSRNYFRLESG